MSEVADQVNSMIVESLLPKIYKDIDALLAVLPDDFRAKEVTNLRSWLPARYVESFQQKGKR